MDLVKDAPSNPSPSRYVCSLHNVRKKSWETSSVTRQYAKLQGKAHGNSTRRSEQYPMPGDPEGDMRQDQDWRTFRSPYCFVAHRPPGSFALSFESRGATSLTRAMR